MAGDWIPWAKGLATKPEILAIARATGLHRREVAGTLMEFWEWADGQTADGLLAGVNLGDLPGLIAGTDEMFWLAVVQAGWLKQTLLGLHVPNFTNWMGLSAKKRLANTIRQRLSRLLRDKVATTVQDNTGEGNLSTDSPAAGGGGENSNKPSAGKKPPNLLFDAIAEVTGCDARASGSHIGRVCKALGNADPPYTPDEVRKLPDILAARGMNVPPHLATVEQCIGWTRQPPPTATRGRAATPRPAQETIAEKIARIRGEPCKP